jgi:hypothetical protein
MPELPPQCLFIYAVEINWLKTSWYSYLPGSKLQHCSKNSIRLLWCFIDSQAGFGCVPADRVQNEGRAAIGREVVTGTCQQAAFLSKDFRGLLE